LELSKSNFTVSDFRSINDKLRKLKLASVLCSHINKTNSHKFLYLTKGNDQEGGSIEIYVMENGVTPVIDLNDTALQSLVKQAKINPKVILIKDIDFYDKFRDLKLFKYQFKKFYSYTSPCRLETIGKKEERYDYIYSNIEVKISDY
jgi:hypothetical protein